MKFVSIIRHDFSKKFISFISFFFMSSRPSRTCQSKKTCLRDYTSSDEEISESDQPSTVPSSINVQRKRNRLIQRIQGFYETCPVVLLLPYDNKVVEVSNYENASLDVLTTPWIAMEDRNFNFNPVRSQPSILPLDMPLNVISRSTYSLDLGKPSSYFLNAMFPLALKPSVLHDVGLGVFSECAISPNQVVLYFVGKYRTQLLHLLIQFMWIMRGN
ncbi:hypothetical protein GEMRC1_000837 [Eukaryota sp. GEM-RC1]